MNSAKIASASQGLVQKASPVGKNPEEFISNLCKDFGANIKVATTLCDVIHKCAMFVAECDLKTISKKHLDMLVRVLVCMLHAAPSHRVDVRDLIKIEKVVAMKMSKEHSCQLTKAIKMLRAGRNIPWRSLLNLSDPYPAHKVKEETLCNVEPCVQAALNLIQCSPQSNVFIEAGKAIPPMFGRQESMLFVESVRLGAKLLPSTRPTLWNFYQSYQDSCAVRAYQEVLKKEVDIENLRSVQCDPEVVAAMPPFMREAFMVQVDPAPPKGLFGKLSALIGMPSLKRKAVATPDKQQESEKRMRIEETEESDEEAPARKARRNLNAVFEPTSTAAASRGSLKHKRVMRSLPSTRSQESCAPLTASPVEAVQPVQVQVVQLAAQVQAEPEQEVLGQVEEVQHEEEVQGQAAEEQVAAAEYVALPLIGKKVRQRREKGAAPTRSSTRRAALEAKSLIKYCIKARNSDLNEARQMAKDNTLEEWLSERSKSSKSMKRKAGLSKPLKPARKR